MSTKSKRKATAASPTTSHDDVDLPDSQPIRRYNTRKSMRLLDHSASESRLQKPSQIPVPRSTTIQSKIPQSTRNITPADDDDFENEENQPPLPVQPPPTANNRRSTMVPSKLPTSRRSSVANNNVMAGLDMPPRPATAHSNGVSSNNTAVNELTKRVTTLTNELQIERTMNEEIQTELDSLTAKYAAAEAQSSSMLRQHQELQALYQQLQTQHADVQQQYTAKCQELTDITEYSTMLETNVGDLQKQVDAMTAPSQKAARNRRISMLAPIVEESKPVIQKNNSMLSDSTINVSASADFASMHNGRSSSRRMTMPSQQQLPACFELPDMLAKRGR